MLSWIWAGFILVAMAAGAWQALCGGSPEVLGAMLDSTFETSRTGFEIALGLTGVMCLWLGVLRVGEAGGAVELVARAVRPLLRRLFPSIPAGHPAESALVMNLAANMLGLDNAATPIGLKAMAGLQELNPDPESVSDDQVLFLVVNASSVTVIPATIFAYRAQLGAANPADVFIPILIATFASTLAGLLVTAFVQRRRLHDPVILAYLLGLTALVGGLALHFARLDQAAVERQSTLLAASAVLAVITAFLVAALWRRVPVYEAFVAGAREGFEVAVRIIPYLVAMLVGIGLLRASGALDLALGGLRGGAEALGLDTRWVEAMPTALMRPLSGSGARGLLIETMQHHGADSFAGRLACVVQGSTETTFYVVAVYLGAVDLRRSRHLVPCCLVADAAGILTAIVVAYAFFG